MKGELPLSVGGLCSEGVELFGRRRLSSPASTATCLFLIMCMSSMPASVACAASNDLNPSIARVTRFVHAPADFRRPLPPMECLLQVGSVLDDPAVEGGVIYGDPPLLHEFFHMTRTQRIRHIPAHARENDLLGKWAPLKLTAIAVPPLVTPSTAEGDYTSSHRK